MRFKGGPNQWQYTVHKKHNEPSSSTPDSGAKTDKFKNNVSLNQAKVKVEKNHKIVLVNKENTVAEEVRFKGDPRA